MDPATPLPSRTVLVTGASGFIGRHLCRSLEASGVRVLGLDLLPGGGVLGDVRDRDLLARLVPEGAWIFHLASVVGVVEVSKRPEETFETCVEGTGNLCELALERGCRLLLASSSEVYGEGGGRLLSEEDALPRDYGPWPRAAYPEGKRRAELLVQEFCTKGGDGRIARLFNVSGPGQGFRGGMVLPTFVHHALRGLPLPVVGDGRDVRCFQHVTDAVRGLLAFMDAEGEGDAVLNLGGSLPVDMEGLARFVLATLGLQGTLRFVDAAERYGMPVRGCRHRVPSIRRAGLRIGHRPRKGLLEIILDLARAMGRRDASPPAESLAPGLPASLTG